MRSAITVLALAATGFVLTADDAPEETTPPATEEATPEAPPAMGGENAEIPEECAKLEDEEAKKKCIADAAAPPEAEAPPAKAGKGRSTSGNMEMEGEADE